MKEKETEKENKEVLTASRYEIDQQLNTYIGNIKVEGLSSTAKLALVKLKLELSKIEKEIEEFRKQTLDSTKKPDNYDKLKEAADKKEATDKDKEAFKKVEEEYNKQLMDILVPYFNERVEIPFEFITEDDFYKLVEHNDVNVLFGYEYIYNKLVKK